MLAIDEDAVVCDLAETYHVYVTDWETVDIPFISTLASGLRETSRIKVKASGQPTDARTLIAAASLDRLNTLVWMRTEDGVKNRNRPPSIIQELFRSDKTPIHETFRTGEDFERARESIIKRLT